MRQCMDINCARFFHAFKDKEECNAMTEKLVKAHEKDGPYDDWCAEVPNARRGDRRAALRWAALAWALADHRH